MEVAALFMDRLDFRSWFLQLASIRVHRHQGEAFKMDTLGNPVLYTFSYVCYILRRTTDMDHRHHSHHHRDIGGSLNYPRFLDKERIPAASRNATEPDKLRVRHFQRKEVGVAPFFVDAVDPDFRTLQLDSVPLHRDQSPASQMDHVGSPLLRGFSTLCCIGTDFRTAE